MNNLLQLLLIISTIIAISLQNQITKRESNEIEISIKKSNLLNNCYDLYGSWSGLYGYMVPEKNLYCMYALTKSLYSREYSYYLRGDSYLIYETKEGQCEKLDFNKTIYGNCRGNGYGNIAIENEHDNYGQLQKDLILMTRAGTNSQNVMEYTAFSLERDASTVQIDFLKQLQKYKQNQQQFLEDSSQKIGKYIQKFVYENPYTQIQEKSNQLAIVSQIDVYENLFSCKNLYGTWLGEYLIDKKDEYNNCLYEVVFEVQGTDTTVKLVGTQSQGVYAGIEKSSNTEQCQKAQPIIFEGTCSQDQYVIQVQNNNSKTTLYGAYTPTGMMLIGDFEQMTIYRQ